jgi:hypothetical protein
MTKNLTFSTFVLHCYLHTEECGLDLQHVNKAAWKGVLKGQNLAKVTSHLDFELVLQ